MSITDELRGAAHYMADPTHDFLPLVVSGDLLAIADCIDAEHQKALDEWKAEHGQMWLKGYSECHAELREGNETLASDLERCGWIRLPVDADGVPIHVGDVVIAQLLFGGESKPLVVDRMELSRGRDGYLWCIALDTDEGCWNQPSMLRHYTPPTVEGVLDEFANAVLGSGVTEDEIQRVIAEYAAKLRLKEDE